MKEWNWRGVVKGKKITEEEGYSRKEKQNRFEGEENERFLTKPTGSNICQTLIIQNITIPVQNQWQTVCQHNSADLVCAHVCLRMLYLTYLKIKKDGTVNQLSWLKLLLEWRLKYVQVAGVYSPFLWLSVSSPDQCAGWKESPVPLVLKKKKEVELQTLYVRFLQIETLKWLITCNRIETTESRLYWHIKFKSKLQWTEGRILILNERLQLSETKVFYIRTNQVF